VNTPSSDGYVNTETMVLDANSSYIAADIWNLEDSPYSGDYTDWYLPSVLEMGWLAEENLLLNLDDGVYWTSNQRSVYDTWVFIIYPDNTYSQTYTYKNKNNSYMGIPIRKFYI
jgi:hypothetical protein